MGLFRTIDRVAQVLSWRFRFYSGDVDGVGGGVCGGVSGGVDGGVNRGVKFLS